MEIGNVLRESRINAKMTVEQVSKVLTGHGYKASPKTVYSWENGNSRPDIEILMKLCNIYGIKDILKTFGYNGYKEDGSIQLNMKEVDMVEKYRGLDAHGKEMVDFTLLKEWERSTAIREHDNTSASQDGIPTDSARIINYYYRLASAGAGQIVFDTPPTKRIEIPNIPEYKKVDYAIGVNGNSMEPVYHDGDMLLVEMTDEIEPGDIGIFGVNNESYVKKLGNGELISLNPEYDNILLTENSKCMGKVVGTLP